MAPALRRQGHTASVCIFTSEEDGKPSRQRAVRRRCGKVRAEQDRLDRYARPLGTKAPTYSVTGLALSPGDITAPLAEDGPRQALFRQFHDFTGRGREAERAAEADADWREVLAAAEAEAGPPPGRVRIWAD